LFSIFSTILPRSFLLILPDALTTAFKNSGTAKYCTHWKCVFHWHNVVAIFSRNTTMGNFDYIF
jgi:hypothetical protein